MKILAGLFIYFFMMFSLMFAISIGVTVGLKSFFNSLKNNKLSKGGKERWKCLNLQELFLM